jgi:NTE family protein
VREANVVRRVAIACQGGGSHTAFTAGVLKRLLRAEELAGHEVVGLSGTSGGAVCALLAWHRLLRGDAAGAVDALDAFWRDNSATTLLEQVVNNWTLWAGNLQNFVAMPAISPYDNYFSILSLEEFKRLLERRVDFQKICVQPEESYPVLLVGAVDVLSGEFRTFNSRRDTISAETILASAAIPTLFRSVRLDGGTYWDGLFSQNPPVRELTDEQPDEIWVIQINPKERASEPRTVAEIADRRNELSGNLSLHQELGFIEKIDQMLEEGHLVRGGKYKQIMVRVIELSRPRFSRFLGTASKLNRDPQFIRELMSHGEARAEEFLTALAFENAWKSRDPAAILALFADDAEIFSSAPFSNRGIHRGTREVRNFVADYLAQNIRVDPTRKQVARNGVAWTVRAPASNGSPSRTVGVVEVEFGEGGVKALRLGTGSG